MTELGIADLSAYRHHLEPHPSEWDVLDGLCRFPISRFGRDRDVFEHLRRDTLPALAKLARERRDHEVRCWSAGCASGEEPYTLRILWDLGLEPPISPPPLRILATDVDNVLLSRARQACYTASSLRDLPPEWVSRAFLRSDSLFRLADRFRQGVEFLEQDVREQTPEGRFHLVLCRNLALTYFDDPTRRDALIRIVDHMIIGGFLVIGKHEVLPQSEATLAGCPAHLGIYRLNPS